MLTRFCASTWRSSSRTRNQPPLPSHIGYWRARISATKMMARIRKLGSAQLMERLEPWVAGDITKVFLDAQKLIVLGDPVRARQRSRLDLTGVGADRDVGDEAVLGLARAMRNDGRVTREHGHADGREGLRQGPDLVDLDQNRISDSFSDALFENPGVGDEQIVADELHFLAELVGKQLPTVPVVLGHAILDRYDRIFVDPGRKVIDHLRARQLRAL